MSFLCLYYCVYIFNIIVTIFFLCMQGAFGRRSSVADDGFAVAALNSTEALMSGFLKSDISAHHQLGGYGAPHPHHSHSHHGALPPGMPMAMTPFGLPHGLDAVGFGQGMWGKYSFFSTYCYMCCVLLYISVVV